MQEGKQSQFSKTILNLSLYNNFSFMKTIEKKSTSSIRFIVGAVNDYDIRYRNLQKFLKKGNLYTLFAQPLVSGKQILWQTPLKGKITKYSNLSLDKQNIADRILEEQAGQIIGTISNKMKTSKIKQYLSIPTKSDIYLVQTDLEDKVVITQWGCVADDADKMPVTIIKDENFPVPVLFIVKYKNGEMATNEDLFIVFNKMANKENSGTEAKIDFGKVVKRTPIQVYQIVEKKKQFFHDFIVDSRIEYFIELPPLQTMHFMVQDTNGDTKSDYSFTFEYAGKKLTQISNENGFIDIEGIKVTTSVKAYHEKSEKKLYPHSFICEEDRDVYILLIPAPIVKEPPPIIIDEPEPYIEPKSKPKPKELKIKLVTRRFFFQKNKPIANQEIEFKHKEKEYKLTTDDEGYCTLIIDEIEKDEIIEALVNIPKKKKEKKSKPKYSKDNANN